MSRRNPMPRAPRDFDDMELVSYIIHMLVWVVRAIIGRMGVKAMLWTIAVLLAAYGLITYFAAPAYFSYVFYQSIIVYWPYMAILVVVIALFVIPTISLIETKEAGWRAAILILLGIAITWAGWSAVSRTTGYWTYHTVASFTPRPERLISHKNIVRFTPLANAFNEMEQSVSAAPETVEQEDTMPFLNGTEFAFMVQITPDDGLLPINAFTRPNPGYVLWHDGPNHKGPKVERIDAPQTYGLRKAWFLDAWFRVYQSDRFAIYEQPHYLRIKENDKPAKIVTVFPKIKHHYMRIPYWAGIAVVHADGKVENLTREQALADSRFKGQWIAPLALFRRYVEDQTMQAGFLSNWLGFMQPGQLKVPDLAGDNQYPFVTVSHDGQPYAYVTTKPVGGGDGLKTIYYQNLATGERSSYTFKDGEVVYGVSAALARVTSIGGWTWYNSEGKGASGQTIAVEPTYIVRPEDPKKIYWKVTVTNLQHKGFSAQIVFDATDLSRFKIFRLDTGEGAGEFYRWLHSTNVVAGDGLTRPTKPSDGLKAGDLKVELQRVLSEAKRLLSRAEEITAQLK